MSSDRPGPYRTPGTTDPDEPAPDPRGPWVLQTWVSQRSCPDCGVALFAARKEGFRIDACGKCGGAWVDTRTLARAIDERSLVPAALADEAAKRAPDPTPNRGDRACPDCAAPLGIEHVQWLGASVVIDVCHAHGSWFDAHELRATIQDRVKAPEVDPEVDRIIAAEARRGALRPPETYEVGYGFVTTRSVSRESDLIADLVYWANRSGR